jgi:uroporphyrinogen III methyltransferase/synthase
VTGHEDPSKPETQVNWGAMAQAAKTGTIVLYMGVKTLPSIAHALINGGLSRDTPAAAVQWGTHARQKTVVATVGTLADRARAEGLTAPVISVIGSSVSLRDEISWFESRPLFGRRIVVTRASTMPGTLSSLLRARGADVVEAPSTEIEPLDQTSLDSAILELSSYDWVIFTSVTGVRFFRHAMDRAGLDARALAYTEIAVIGPSTEKAVRELGVRADLVPHRFVAESLLEELIEDEIEGGRILIAAAADSREVLATGLREHGAHVDVVHPYRSRLVTEGSDVDSLRNAIDAGEIDAVTFTSASTVNGFVAQVGADRAKRVKAISIGPVTSEAARAAGMSIAAEASEATIPSLADSVVASLAG